MIKTKLKNKISLCLAMLLVVISCNFNVYATGTGQPDATIYTDEVSHFTDTATLRFSMTDDKSLKDGFFVFFNGRPEFGNQLYAERIEEDSDSVKLTRTIDITSCGSNETANIYLVVIDADGNESAYTHYINMKVNDWRSPAIQVKNPAPDNKSNLYAQYIGYYPTFNPSISITDHDSTSFTCKYYVDSVLKETKQVSFSSTGLHTITFDNAIDTSSLSNMIHSIKFEVTDGSNTGTYFFHFIKL